MAGRFQGSGRFRKTGRDYSQLDLFADLPETTSSASPETTETLIEAASQPQTEATDGRHEPVGRPDSETLANPPAGVDRGTGADEPVAVSYTHLRAIQAM